MHSNCVCVHFCNHMHVCACTHMLSHTYTIKIITYFHSAMIKKMAQEKSTRDHFSGPFFEGISEVTCCFACMRATLTVLICKYVCYLGVTRIRQTTNWKIDHGPEQLRNKNIKGHIAANSLDPVHLDPDSIDFNGKTPTDFCSRALAANDDVQTPPRNFSSLALWNLKLYTTE